ncbi:MAG: 50S ribosomal protein L20 [Candidatus Portnoybacteria bacterium CG10_big_fil_rev_8_21_14_0_10_36_7]|uniref:Large ribosomal subunit protein bL20 n=1 Tax=Candidatus Portnoybacteria bacterium CG10_big_fil_rev_8_21_14_0_10_36_7 TaxID=1974812 RepID=A0A2M8KDA5_9BACT|nr:MAG: 50S ribosomal protein L20 [Candidatus Portnoybacteria bacterium CG10_big_fil_rev_8_21_14_0_10_36_7]
MRIKRSVASKKRRKNVISQAKGYRWGRKSKFRLAKDALMHAQSRAYSDRKKKKRVMRSLWNIKINALLRAQNMKYSVFINQMKKAKIVIDRKVLAQLAKNHPTIFNEIVAAVKK